MSQSPFATYPVPERAFIPSTPRTVGTPSRGTGAKRGRKPKNATVATISPRASATPAPVPAQVQWVTPQSGPDVVQAGGSTSASGSSSAVAPGPSSEGGTVLSLPGVVITPPTDPTVPRPAGAPAAEEDGEGEDELLPAMADDDYSAQLSWQSQSKDNLKCVTACRLYACSSERSLRIILRHVLLSSKYIPLAYT